jgi:hypothetical protein
MTAIPSTIQQAHRHSSHHRAEIEGSALCGCFYCETFFKPATIVDWIDEDGAGLGQTALCPSCGVDSVIGDGSGYPITLDFLSQMKQVYF